MRSDPWAAIFEARNRLASYIDALWQGRASAARPLEGFYTERLAAAARLMAFLHPPRSVEAIRGLVRQENGTFSHDVLATEAGRQARSAFNLFARYAAILEDYLAPDGSVPTGPETIVGERLGYVSFGPGWIDLNFDGSRFKACCPVVLHAADGSWRSDGTGLRDRLCDALGRTVRSIDIGDTEVTMDLSDLQIALVFSEGDADDPEPLVFWSLDHRMHVFRPGA